MDKIIVHFKHLYCLPYVNIGTLDPQERDCSICFETYHKKPSGSTEPSHRPVQLACGHVFGLRCLAAWVFSPNFNNRCCYCKVRLIPAHQHKRDKTYRIIEELWQLRQSFGGRFTSRQEQHRCKELMGGLLRAKNEKKIPANPNHLIRIFDEYLKTLGQGVPSQAGSVTVPNNDRHVVVNNVRSFHDNLIIVLVCLAIALWASDLLD